MPPPPPAAFADLLAAFLEYEQAVAGLSASTLRHRDLYLRTFLTWWQTVHPGVDPASATTAQLGDFVIAEGARGISPATRRAQITALRRLFAWMVLTGRATADPTLLLRSPRLPPRDIRVYRPEEATAILDHVAGLDGVRGRLRHVIVATLRYTGMRQGELRRLALADVDIVRGRARVVGKGRLVREVVLPDPLLPILRDYLADVRPALPGSPLLLVNPHVLNRTADAGFSPEAVFWEVEQAGRRSGVAGPHHPHRWRHTFATECVRAGLDIHVVQRLLGHRNIASTIDYTHLAADDLAPHLDGLWT